ncbi:MAG: hypothetical protein CM15mV6_1990 [uncultured marine virus]|nr:MAG: hypothetical protein CM15mV6_1990 [uncultured marine virus]
MINKLISEFPRTDVVDIGMTERKIRQVSYTKEEVDALIAEAIEEARRIDEESMRKHNRDATVISMILGFTALALFVDGLLRMLGIIPPFMHIDINILDRIVDEVKNDLGKRFSHQYRGMDYGSKILVIQFLKGITYGLFAHFILKVIFDLRYK